MKSELELESEEKTRDRVSALALMTFHDYLGLTLVFVLGSGPDSYRDEPALLKIRFRFFDEEKKPAFVLPLSLSHSRWFLYSERDLNPHAHTGTGF